MRTYLTILVLVLASWPRLATAGVAWGRYGSNQGRPSGELWAGLECALKRWRAATGLDLDVSLAGPHYVRWRAPEDVPGGGSGWVEGPFTSTRTYVSSALAAHRVCPVLVHEIGHVLRRSYGHSPEDGSMSYPVVHVDSEPVSRITAGDLALVCAVQACTQQIPEG